MDSKIPNIRFKGFTDAWEQRRLGEVTIYQNGKGYEDSQSSSGKFELINLNSISIDGGLKSSGKYIESADKTLLTDDLVMVLSDVGKGDLLGRVAIIPKDNYYVLNQRVALIRPKNKQQTNYLFSYINSHQRYFKLHGAGMSQLNISKGSVENFPLLLPSLPEQQQIGTFFAHLDTLISLHQRKCDQTKELKKTMLQKMFPKKGETVPEIRFPEFTDAWEQRKVDEVTTSYSGGTPQAGNSEYYNGTIPFIRSGEIYKNHAELFITQKGLENSSAKMVSKGDILYALYGATSGEVSRSNINGAINQAILAITPNKGYNADFIVEWFRNEKENIIDKYLQGGQGNLSAQIIKNLEIPFPTFEEQEKVGGIFTELNHLITLHQRKCDELKEIKKTLLKNLFI